MCGPAAFMTAVHDALIDLGLAPDRLHTELFGALPPVNPGVVDVHRTSPHQPPGSRGTGPDITFARSGLTVAWSPAYRSVLELAEACDVPTRWSCRTGVCHTCETAVLSGDPTYATEPLELPAVGNTLICCAVPSGDLVLDL